MVDGDKSAFATLVGNVYAFYQKESSAFVLGVWWETLKDCELEDVRRAFNRHAKNPDSGQFLPRPSDLFKLIEGTSTDKAVVAWATVVDAIRTKGPYVSVQFDDPRVTRIVIEMGGWPKVCEVTNDELPFRQREFENRYRAMLNTAEPVNALAHVAGLVEENTLLLSRPMESEVQRVPAIGVSSWIPARRMLSGKSGE